MQSSFYRREDKERKQKFAHLAQKKRILLLTKMTFVCFGGTDRSLPPRYDTPTSEPEPLSLSSLDSNPRNYNTDYYSNYPQQQNVPQQASYSPQPGSSSPRSPSPRQQLSPAKTRRHSTSEQRRPLLPDKPKTNNLRMGTVKGGNADPDTDYPVKWVIFINLTKSGTRKGLFPGNFI